MSNVWKEILKIYYLQHFKNYENRGIIIGLLNVRSNPTSWQNSQKLLRATHSSSKSGAMLSGLYYKDNLEFFLILSTVLLVL